MAGCKKDTPQPFGTLTKVDTDNYSSMADFLAKNGPQMQTYTINGATGGSFTTPQGTLVNIPANAFYTDLMQIVTGPVTINFKDIYKKSDMLLSKQFTTTITGTPLKSGGEFFIQATSGGSPLTLANRLTITQPLNGVPIDTSMQAYVKTVDTLGWAAAACNASIRNAANSYIHTLIQLPPPSVNGTWCNSDHPCFTGYPQCALTVNQTDTGFRYNTSVCLFFKGLNTCYGGEGPDGNNRFGNSYWLLPYVPTGFQFTLIACNVKYGKLYSSFTTLTLSANQTVNFSMTETTTADFQAAINALN